jgi:hypothetical protein
LPPPLRSLSPELQSSPSFVTATPSSSSFVALNSASPSSVTTTPTPSSSSSSSLSGSIIPTPEILKPPPGSHVFTGAPPYNKKYATLNVSGIPGIDTQMVYRIIGDEMIGNKRFTNGPAGTKVRYLTNKTAPFWEQIAGFVGKQLCMKTIKYSSPMVMK